MDLLYCCGYYLYHILKFEAEKKISYSHTHSEEGHEMEAVGRINKQKVNYQFMKSYEFLKYAVEYFSS